MSEVDFLSWEKSLAENIRRLFFFVFTTVVFTFIGRRQSSGLYRSLLGPVSDNVLKNRASTERALHQVIKYSHCAI